MPALAGIAKVQCNLILLQNYNFFLKVPNFFLKKIKNRWILKLVETIISEY